MIKVVMGKDNETAIEIRAGEEIRVPRGCINLCVWFRGIDRDKLNFRQALILMGQIWAGKMIPWEVILEVPESIELQEALREAQKLAETELMEPSEDSGDGEPLPIPEDAQGDFTLPD